MVVAESLRTGLDSQRSTIASAGRCRVCILSERLSSTPEEGINKFAAHVARALDKRHDVALLATRGPASLPGAELIPLPRTFLSPRLGEWLTNHGPDVLIYCATASASFWSFARSRVLKRYCPQSTVVLVGLQARRHSGLQRRVIRYLVPDLLCVQSEESRRYFERLGCTVALTPSGVDVDTFHPVPADKRDILREKYGLRADAPVVLHVGHLQQGRGIGVLAELARSGVCQVALVASSSTEQDVHLARELRSAGVTVFDRYLSNVEELYQASDCYVFPVESTGHAIEVPLSVLEAFACDLPVVATRFAALPDLFSRAPCDALVFTSSTADLVAESLRLCQSGARGTRPLAMPFAWDAVADGLLAQALSARSIRR